MAASRPSRIPASCRSACCCPARRRRHRRALDRRALRQGQHHHHRHRRHVGRHFGDRAGRVAHQEPARHRGRRPSRAGADDRHRRDRRRRRLDRLSRSGRRLRVGPRSAGAVPGPACYAKGGEEPTVTDAVVLGRMDPEHFLGGDPKIDASLSRRRSQAYRRAARPFGGAGGAGHPEDVNNNMALAINANSVAKGIDPRNFSLMGFGGAGAAAFGVAGRSDLAKDVMVPVHPASRRRPACWSPTCSTNTRIRRCWCWTRCRRRSSAGQRRARRADLARQPPARRGRHSGGKAAFPPGRGMPLCRPGFRAARRHAQRPAHGGIRRDGHREFLQCAQAGLRPRLPRPVLRDHHAARHRHGGGRYAEAAEARQGRRTNPGGGGALRRRTVFDDGKAAGRRATSAKSCSRTTLVSGRR